MKNFNFKLDLKKIDFFKKIKQNHFSKSLPKNNIEFSNSLKKINIKALFRKYNYDIDKVIGVKDEKRYILYIDRKLIRIYRDKLKSTALLCSYIPIEDVIFYDFELEKNVIDKVDLDTFVETKAYEEAGINETERYKIKYKVVDKLKDDKKVIIETVIVPVSLIEYKFKPILEETHYIDYLAFPAFSYKALYEEGILKEGNDLFVVILFDKMFITFYSEGELVFAKTISGGLNKIYESLKKLKISGYDKELFKKLLTKKGLSEIKYNNLELVILEKLKNSFSELFSYLFEEINNLKSRYDVSEIDRVFMTTEYGSIKELDFFLERQIKIDVKSFEFYEKYNLDRLPVDPFLFLAMLEAHYAYKYNNQRYNFSDFLRKPTFFYRPSGILFSVILVSTILISIYPFYLYLEGKKYEKENKILENKFNSLLLAKAKLQQKLNKLQNQSKSLENNIKKLKLTISSMKDFIYMLYKFKYSYLFKSQELVDINLLMNNNDIYVKNIEYKDNGFIIDVYSYKQENIPKFVKELINNGFLVSFDKIVLKNDKYTSLIRIKE